jgi:nicotinamidase-related amidase
LEIDKTDIVITKHRVSAFYRTPLDLILRNKNINSILIAGAATDLSVSNAVRDAHDRDYQVTILADCCVAANQEDHETTLLSLKNNRKCEKCLRSILMKVGLNTKRFFNHAG